MVIVADIGYLRRGEEKTIGLLVYAIENFKLAMTKNRLYCASKQNIF